MDKVFDYIANGGNEAAKQAASMEYLEGVLGGVLRERDELLAALTAIAAMPDENDEWDGRDKFREVRAIAQNALKS